MSDFVFGTGRHAQEDTMGELNTGLPGNAVTEEWEEESAGQFGLDLFLQDDGGEDNDSEEDDYEDDGLDEFEDEEDIDDDIDDEFEEDDDDDDFQDDDDI